MATPMSLEIISGADSVTVLVTGEVDMGSKELLEEAMSELGGQPQNLMVDLRGVTFIDSMGLAMLLRIHRLCEANGGSLALAAPSDNVRKLLRLSQLDSVLTVLG